MEANMTTYLISPLMEQPLPVLQSGTVKKISQESK